MENYRCRVYYKQNNIKKVIKFNHLDYAPFTLDNILNTAIKHAKQSSIILIKEQVIKISFKPY